MDPDVQHPHIHEINEEVVGVEYMVHDLKVNWKEYVIQHKNPRFLRLFLNKVVLLVSLWIKELKVYFIIMMKFLMIFS